MNLDIFLGKEALTLRGEVVHSQPLRGESPHAYNNDVVYVGRCGMPLCRLGMQEIQDTHARLDSVVRKLDQTPSRSNFTFLLLKLG